MISFVLATALAAAAQAGPPLHLRQAYSACLGTFLKAKIGEKLEDAAFLSGAKTACASQEAAFRDAIVAYDVKMGMKKAAAVEGAVLQIDDYLAGTAENYKARAHAKPK